MDKIIACGFVIRSARGQLVRRSLITAHHGAMYPAIYATTGEAETALMMLAQRGKHHYWGRATIVPVVIAEDPRGISRQGRGGGPRQKRLPLRSGT